VKPFNLQQAIEGKPIVDQFGRPVQLIAHVPDAVESHRVAYLSHGGYVQAVGENGCPFSSGQYWEPALYMADETK
jgi:hypothetical protein